MNAILTFLSVNTTFFTFLGYPMSYIEFFGTLANLWSVWLVAKKNILTWPVGIVGVILFLYLFYQINLYSDLIEQGYFLVTSIWGWWMWNHTKSKQADIEIQVERSTLSEHIKTVVVTIVGALGLLQLSLNLPRMLPNIFTVSPSFAVLDALTTSMSFVATYLMIKRKVSCWYYWIFVDVIGIGLYYAKDVKFLSLLYLIFLLMAIKGLIIWKKSGHQQQATNVA